MFRLLAVCALVAAVSGCAMPQPYASDAEIAEVAYRHPGPPSVTLITMVNNRTGRGGHSALMINASQRVIFDPAGSFYADVVPERNDVLFGISPAVAQAYRGAHARSTFHVVSQTVEVTPEQAEMAYQLALANGPVAGVWCSNATANLLKKVPGFEDIKVVFEPTKLMAQFEQIPGVVTDKYYEWDDENLQKGLFDGNQALNQQVD